MRKILISALLSLSYFSFAAESGPGREPKKKYYYFCLSREIPFKEKRDTKPQFVYTDMYEVTGDENDIRRLTDQFANYIDKQCKPGNETCTSDLNYYQDRQLAEKRYKETLTKYKQIGKYSLKHISLKLY